MTTKLVKGTDKLNLAPLIAEKLGIDKEKIISIEPKYKGGIIFVNAGVVNPNDVEIKNIKVKYVTNLKLLDWHESITYFYSAMNYYKSFDNCELFEVKDTNEFYELKEKDFENLKKDLKETVKKIWNKDLALKVAKEYADYPIDLKVIGDFEKIELKYHPVSHWCGDEWRGGDCLRSSVDNEKVEVSVEEFKWFIEPFESIIENLFFKHAKKVGEKRETTIEDEDFIKIANQKLKEYLLKEKIKRTKSDLEIIKNKIENNEATMRDYAYILKYDEEGFVKIDEDLLNRAKNVLSHSKFLIECNGEVSFIDLKKNLISPLSIDNKIVEIIEDENINNIFDLDDEILNKYGILKKYKEKTGIDGKVNVIVNEDTLSKYERFIEKIGGKIYIYPLNLRNKMKNIAFIKFNNNAETKNLSDFHNGLIIGKGGKTIKDIAKNVGLKFIKITD